MATVYIGSARIDERGRARGGKAGDQTGREVSRQRWYNRILNPWVVLRPKVAEHAEKIARCMERACANGKIGYDQGQRDSLSVALSRVDGDPSKVDKAVETDCSKLVHDCCKYAGIDVKIPAGQRFYTGNMAAILMATGMFEKLTAAKYVHSPAYLKRGDILVTRRQGHTVAVLSNGSKVVPAAPAQATACRVTGDGVNVRSGPSTGYDVLGKVNKGAVLELSGEQTAAWTGVLYGGQKAYISSVYVTPIN